MGNLGRGRWIFDLAEKGSTSDELLCYQWFVSASVISPNPSLQCPPTTELASFDPNFFLMFFSPRRGIACYGNIFPIRGPGVQCCYSLLSGALLTLENTPGGVLSRNPFFFSNADDEFGFQKCCVDTSSCIAYRIRRPKQRGRSYIRPRRGKTK